jgi:hypothetical protein
MKYDILSLLRNSALLTGMIRLGRLSKESAQVQGPFVIFRSKYTYHPLSAVSDCLFDIFFNQPLHIWRTSPPPPYIITSGRAVPWWQGDPPPHLTWGEKIRRKQFTDWVRWPRSLPLYDEILIVKKSNERFCRMYIFIPPPRVCHVLSRGARIAQSI